MVCLGASTALAGEITGNGKSLKTSPTTVHGRSECAFSGLQDDAAADAGVFKGDRVQNWGQLTDFGRFIFAEFFGIESNNEGCNPVKSGGE